MAFQLRAEETVAEPGFPYVDGADALVPLRPRQRVVLIAVFAAYLLAVVIVGSIDAPPHSSLIVAALLGLVVAKLAPLFIPGVRLGWFHPFVIGIVFTGVGLFRTFSMYTEGLPWHLGLPNYTSGDLSKLIAYELLLKTVGVLVYYAGFVLGRRAVRVRPWRFDVPLAMARKTVVMVGFSIVVALAFLASHGGITTYMLSWSLGRHELLSGQIIWIFVASMGSAGILVWLAMDRSCLRNPVFWACCVVMLPIPFLLSGSRSLVVHMLVISVLVWMLRERRVVVIPLLFGIAVAVYALGWLGHIRRSTWRDEIDVSGANSVSFTEGLSETWEGEIRARSTTEGGALPILARVPDQVAPLYGSSYLAVLATPIPRKIWPGKPNFIGGQVGETFFAVRAGVPPGAIGEAYWNFHIPGVIAVFFLFGVFHRWLVSRMEENQCHPALIAPYIATLYLFSEPTGDGVVQALWNVVPMIVALYFFAVIGRQRSRHPSRVRHDATRPLPNSD